MNLHLLYDNNYSQWFIESVLTFLPESKNRFIVYNSYAPASERKPKYVTHPSAEYLPILERGQTLLKEQVDLSQTKNVIIHFYEAGLKKHIISLPNSIKVKWLVWGAEMFVPIGKYLRYQLDDFSYSHYNSFNFKKEWQRGVWIFISSFKAYSFQNSALIKYWQHHSRTQAIERVDEIYTYLQGDYDTIIKNYRFLSPPPFQLFHYQYVTKHINKVELDKIEQDNIQIGHNATPFNNQYEVIEQLAKIKDKNFSIIMPLSYGDMTFREKLLAACAKFSNLKINAVKEMLILEDYNKMLATIKVHIFNNKRQEAMGNIIACVAQGKKVYLSELNTAFDFFKTLNCKVFSIEKDLIQDAQNGNLLQELTLEEKTNNQQQIYNFFSVENYIKVLKTLLN